MGRTILGVLLVAVSGAAQPAIRYSALLGGTGGATQITAAARDGSGNVYVAGYTSAPDFPVTTPPSQPFAANDVFVAKLTGDGATIMYSTLLGVGSPMGIAV